MSRSAFDALGVSADLVAPLTALGIIDPSPIQSAVIADALAGRDIIGRAPTGSGKTLAFGIPLIDRVDAATKRRPRGLILAPTRELAGQIADALEPLARARRLSTVAVYGGVGYGHQRRALDNGVDVVVACPGRLEDLLQMGALVLDDVTHVVIDEADRMADMGFLPSVRRLVKLTKARRQTMLFSATLDGAIAKLAAEIQHDPARHEVGPAGPDVTAAQHCFWRVDPAERLARTADVVNTLGSTMVFCRTRHGADRLSKQLIKHGVSAAPIHGGRSQGQRERALQAFASGTVSTLVATDVAARGVHVDDVAAVVHFDPPADAATYIHRSGRTARAGAAGVVVSLIVPGIDNEIRKMQREIGIDAEIAAPSTADLRSAGTGAPKMTAAAPVAESGRRERSDDSDRRNAAGGDAGRRARGREDRSGRAADGGATASRAGTAERNGGHSRTDGGRHGGRKHDGGEGRGRNSGAGRSERGVHSERGARTERGAPGHRRQSTGAGQRVSGTVSFFHSRRGYGFISTGNGPDVFVHQTHVADRLARGQRVEFAVRDGERGPEALDVVHV